MKVTFLVVGAIAAGITLFVWGAVIHAALPLSEWAMTEFLLAGSDIVWLG